MERGYVALNLLLSHVFYNNLVAFNALLFITSYLALGRWIERHTVTYGIYILALYFISYQNFMSTIRQSVVVDFILWALMAWEDLKG